MHYDVIIIGAGASGMFCAATAGQRGRNVLLLDHNKKSGNKIAVAGGGKCNFTNLNLDAKKHYVCGNKYFPISALSRYTQWDFLDLIDRYKIPYEEREHSQLFCQNSSKDILEMLRSELRLGAVQVRLKTEIDDVKQLENGGFSVIYSGKEVTCESLVIATGGPALPGAGATNWGSSLAEKMGLNVIETRPGLVPLTTPDSDLKALAGLNFPVTITLKNHQFSENLLITHRGISGPVTLQASNYWQGGDVLSINLLPKVGLEKVLAAKKAEKNRALLGNIISEWLPKRFVVYMLKSHKISDRPLNKFSEKELQDVGEIFNNWQFKPGGSEGYRTAEVSLGGVDTDEISSKTMEAKKVKGLYFIGEVLDVVGHLGGYNLQWAWASGHCAGQYV